MKPLSALSFIKGSFSKLLPMVTTVCLAVAILYFMSMFTEQLDTQVNETNTYPLKNMSIVLGGKTGISNDEMQSIINNIGDNKSFLIDLFDVSYNSIVGKTGAYIVMSQQKDIMSIMNLQNHKLLEGELPQKPMEVILHKKLALNYGLKVGSVVKKETKGWYINKDVKVVGIFEGKGVTGIGMVEENLLKIGNPYISLAIGGDENSMITTNKYIEKNFSSKFQILTLSTMESFMDNFNSPISAIKLFVGIVLVGVIGVFLVNITTIQYSLRRKELELLHAIGYTRKYIIKKALKEIGIAAVIGYFCGIILAVLLGWGINICFLSEKGLDMPLILPSSMITMLLVPFAITLFSMLAPLKLTRFRDLV